MINHINCIFVVTRWIDGRMIRQQLFPVVTIIIGTAKLYKKEPTEQTEQKRSKEMSGEIIIFATTRRVIEYREA